MSGDALLDGGQRDEAGTTSTTYDLAGQALTTTDARGQTLAFTYDVLGRRTAQYADTTSGTKLAEWHRPTASEIRCLSRAEGQEVRVREGLAGVQQLRWRRS
uniref:RHS repeat domain-containing protein n=1 Tax=Saccharothrix tamanrassetensis TaxID=1051531 RepID=UPI0016194EF7